MRALSRRDLLKQGGAGALALALLGAPSAAAAAGTGLTPRRRAAYRSLVEALATAPESSLRHRDAGAAVREFADWYGGQDPAIRAHADAVLDHLDGLGLSRRTPSGALRELRERSAAGNGSPSPAQAVHCAMVAAAMGLAGASA